MAGVICGGMEINCIFMSDLGTQSNKFDQNTIFSPGFRQPVLLSWLASAVTTGPNLDLALQIAFMNLVQNELENVTK